MEITIVYFAGVIGAAAALGVWNAIDSMEAKFEMVDLVICILWPIVLTIGLVLLSIWGPFKLAHLMTVRLIGKR